MYGGRNDEDGSFSDVSCYDISKDGMWAGLGLIIMCGVCCGSRS